VQIGLDVTDAQTRLPISALKAADSPRLNGENECHIAMLSQAAAPLPPILVNRATLRVVDGMHRLRAARLNGVREIDVSFFDGDDDASFVMAVRANVTHGMPLTRADRSAAAARIVATYPYWSDRRIAEATGLSPKTVGAIRQRCAINVVTPRRIGRDGKVRSMPSAARGVAPSPLPVEGHQVRRPADPSVILWSLRRDPALRFTEAGRIVLRLLNHSDSIPRAELDILIEAIPAHCVERVADLARQYSAIWIELARRLDQDSATQFSASATGARSSCSSK
jgi:hypothetical protein